MQRVQDSGRTATLVLELSSGTALLHGEEVELPLREFRLLAELASRVGDPVASADLIEAVWPDEPWTPKENLYILVTRLRAPGRRRHPVRQEHQEPPRLRLRTGPRSRRRRRDARRGGIDLTRLRFSSTPPRVISKRTRLRRNPSGRCGRGR